MRAEIVGVGTEILVGDICNDNAAWMSRALADIGVDVLHHQAVGDNRARIAESIRLAVSRADAVLVTGGLGPTQDDITREGLSDALEIPLEREPQVERFLRDLYARWGRPMPEANLQQADVPRGGRYWLPKRGTAPGLAVQASDGTRVYCVAGVPAEMREMMSDHILPELSALAGPATLAYRSVKVVGVAESRIAELLDDLFRAGGNPAIAYLAGHGEVRVRISAKAVGLAEAQAMIEPVEREVAARLGDAVFGYDEDTLEGVVGRLLVRHGRRLACAESLTGGELGARISETAGASEYFLGSAVTYTAEAKHAILGVSQEVLDGPGVVSEACAREMAEGALRAFGADVAVSLTGAAGPEPHDGADPGTVFAGLAVAGQPSAGRVREMHLRGDRAMIRRWSEQQALDLVRRHLQGLPEPPAATVPVSASGN
jgi:nicotinamide-nucleotide amidase